MADICLFHESLLKLASGSSLANSGNFLLLSTLILNHIVGNIAHIDTQFMILFLNFWRVSEKKKNAQFDEHKKTYSSTVKHEEPIQISSVLDIF